MRSVILVVSALLWLGTSAEASLRPQQKSRSHAYQKDPSSTFTLQGKQPVHTNPESQRLVDEWNREVYFHGVNVVVKGRPWIPETDHFNVHNSFSDKDMATLQELGLNAIRLGTMWPGAEPERIYKLVDVHPQAQEPHHQGRRACRRTWCYLTASMC